MVWQEKLYYDKNMKKDHESVDCCQEQINCKGHGCHHVRDVGCSRGGSSNAIYGLGVVGALFYFLKGASTFGLVMTGIGKAIFWPAILMFKLLTYLNI